ncbi:MAG TPA: M13 family metallopeptidase [Caulobacteraceae bacterium]|nr:M13 family metallopeptidase [Caulobacteraceae bacterium]
MRLRVLLPILAAIAVCACSQPARKAAAASPPLDKAGMDLAVAPGDDFFAYANGAWDRTAVIPPERSTWGTFAQLAELTQQRTRDIVEAAAKDGAQEGPAARKVGDYYTAFTDEAGIDAKGLAPIQPRLSAIAAIADKAALARDLGANLRADVDPMNATNFHTDNLFGLWVSPDLHQADVNVGYLLQGGLGMPDRDYYLGADAKMVAYQQAYLKHIAAVLRLAGVADPDGKAARILGLERKIAAAHVSRADSEDVHKADNPWALADFARKAPGLDWAGYFRAAGLDGQKRLYVWQPGAITGLSALVAAEPLDVWKDYLAFHALDHHADVLPKAFRDENFAFYGQTLTGALEPRPRWKRGIDAVNGALGDAVGQLYVARWFPPAAKAEVQRMVANIEAAFGRRIEALAWMAPQTKAKAEAKLKTLYVGIGYPEHWRDYGALAVARDQALANFDAAERNDYRYAVGKLGRPVDKSEWWMTPQTVNAVNLPMQNGLNFPAAILQPPFYQAGADPAVNYGAIGTTIGHEISHSFDDQGSQFDASGQLANWWTPADAAHFKAAGERLAQEFDGYEPLPGLHVNGHQTLSENIADVAGVAASLDAYHAALGGRAPRAVEGLGGDQAFFVKYAQTWRFKAREPALRRQVLTDGHAPAPYRADTVRNLDAWYTAFAVKPGAKLYLAPPDRALVW